MSAQFVAMNGFPVPGMNFWDPIVVKKSEIDAEIERLAGENRPANGIRAARIVHPMSTAPGLGMTPGIDVTINVLKPGEESTPIRHNSTQISICLRGQGRARVAAREFAIEKFDVWNTPGMHPYRYRNDGHDLLVRLTYSNGALLEKLQIHYVEEIPAGGFAVTEDLQTKVERIRGARDMAKPIPLGDEGAQLLTYEHLISPEVVDNKALLWPWKLIERERDRVFPIGRSDRLGRRGLFVLYNPATGRTVGTTHNFFASLGFMPAQVVDRPHRHSSNAINYALEGSFVSTVNGIEVEWNAGDLAYTAPGWSPHANGSRNHSGGTALTVQDHPFQIATESLIWQEGDDTPILLLGAQEGFEATEATLVA